MSDCSYTFTPTDVESLGIHPVEAPWRCPHERFEGTDYCVFHLPREEPERLDDPAFLEAQRCRLVSALEGDGRPAFVRGRFGRLSLVDEEFAPGGSGPIDLRHATFGGRLDLVRVRFEAPVWFDGASFESPVTVEESTFEEALSAQEATFRGVEFRGVTVEAVTRFDHTEFEGLDPAAAQREEERASRRRRAGTRLRANFRGGCYLSGATFRDDADLRGSTVGRYCRFVDAEFHGDVEFGTVRFVDPARETLNESLEEAAWDFRDMKVAGGTGFEGCTFRGGALFKRANFALAEGALDADPDDGDYDLTAATRVTFDDATFDGTVSFRDATVPEARFSRARFAGDATFTETTFLGAARFGGDKPWMEHQEAVFEGTANFFDATFESSADFHRVEFRGDAKFTRATFSEPPSFYEAEFTDRVKFDGVDLGGSNFRDAVLRGAGLSGADLSGANFRGARLEGADLGRAVLDGTDFTSGDLAGATLRNLREPELREATLTQADLSMADMAGTDLRGGAVERAVFSRANLYDADLTDARIDGALFGDVQVNAGTDFGHVDGDGSGTFRIAYDREPSPETLPGRVRHAFRRYLRVRPLWDDVDAPPAETNAGSATPEDPTDDGEGADADATANDAESDATANEAPTRRREAQMRKAGGSYQAIERLARENALPELQTTAFVRRQEMNRLRYGEEASQRNSLLAWSRWARASGARLILLYGESPWRIIAWSLGIVTSFALVYPYFGLIESSESGLLTWNAVLQQPDLLVDSFYFSTITYTALELGEFAPANAWGQVATILESASGVVLLALLVFVLGRRAAR